MYRVECGIFDYSYTHHNPGSNIPPLESNSSAVSDMTSPNSKIAKSDRVKKSGSEVDLEALSEQLSDLNDEMGALQEATGKRH